MVEGLVNYPTEKYYTTEREEQYISNTTIIFFAIKVIKVPTSYRIQVRRTFSPGHRWDEHQAALKEKCRTKNATMRNIENKFAQNVRFLPYTGEESFQTVRLVYLDK